MATHPTMTASIPIRWHLLGSISGYCTLGASVDVSDADRVVLETLGFGQSDDEAFLASIATKPSVIGRPLPSGRYGVTRLFEGQLDSAGRRTLLLGTVILERHDWIRCASMSLPSLIEHQSLWSAILSRGAPEKIALRPVPSTAATRSTVLQFLSAWLQSRQSSDTLIAADSAIASAAILMLPSVLPPTERCQIRWGLRLLSTGLPVDICTLAPVAERSSRRRLVDLERKPVEPHEYARALEFFWPVGEPPPRVFCDDSPTIESAVTRTDRERPAAVANPRVQYRTPALVLLAAMLIGGLVVGGALVARATRNAPQLSTKPSQVEVRSIAAEDLRAMFRDRATWTRESLQAWIRRAEAVGSPTALTSDESGLLALAQSARTAYERLLAIDGRLQSACQPFLPGSRNGLDALSPTDLATLALARDEVRDMIKSLAADWPGLAADAKREANRAIGGIWLRHQSVLYIARKISVLRLVAAAHRVSPSFGFIMTLKPTESNRQSLDDIVSGTRTEHLIRENEMLDAVSSIDAVTRLIRMTSVLCYVTGDIIHQIAQRINNEHPK